MISTMRKMIRSRRRIARRKRMMMTALAKRRVWITAMRKIRKIRLALWLMRANRRGGVPAPGAMESLISPIINSNSDPIT